MKCYLVFINSGESLSTIKNFASFNPSVSPDSFYIGLGGAFYIMSNIKTHPLYCIVTGMMNRCHREYHKDYPRYGGKGIVMDKSWRGNARKCIGDIEDAIGPRPSQSHSIDRINTNGNYEIGNIRWATMREQNNNRNNNRKVTVKGRTLNIVQWSRRMGVSRQMIRYRLEAGWSDEDAVLKPAGYGNRSKK